MSLEEAIAIRDTFSRKELSRLINHVTVVRNILTGAYAYEDAPLEVAREDLDLLNGDKTL